MKTLLFALIMFCIVLAGCTKEEAFIPQSNLFLVGQTYLTGTKTDDFGFRFTSEYAATKLIVGANGELTEINSFRVFGAYPNLIIDGQKTEFTTYDSFIIGSFVMTKQ